MLGVTGLGEDSLLGVLIIGEICLLGKLRILHGAGLSHRLVCAVGLEGAPCVGVLPLGVGLVG